MALQVWLPLNRDLIQQGLNNISVTNNGATYSSTGGKLGGCYSFDGNSYIDTNYGNSLTVNNKTFVCWFKPTADCTNDVIFGALNGSNQRCYVGISNNTYNLAFGSTSYGRTTTASVVINQWVHIAMAITNNTAKLYINGIFIESLSNSNSFNLASNIFIGGRSDGYKTNSLINDFRIYDHCLSSQEIKELAKGLILWYPLENNGFGQPNLLPNTSGAVREYTYPTSGTYQDKWSAQTSEIPTGSSYILSFWAKSTVNGDKIRAHYYNPNTTTTVLTSQGVSKNSASDGHIDFTLSTTWTYYWVIYGQSNTTAKKTIIFPRMGTPGNTSGVVSGTGTVSIRGVKLEEGSIPTPWCPNINDSTYTSLQIGGTTEYDSSGFCNNSTKIGTFTYTSDTPKYAVSTHFNGSSAIKDTTFPFSSNQWSVTFWYKFTTAPSAYQGFICLSRNSGADADKKIAAMPNSSYIWFKFESINYSLQSLKVNEWCHIVMTCDGNNGKIYENGVLKYTTGSVGTILTNCDDLVIGARANSTNAETVGVYLNNCSMSDVRIYATALSANDVLSLYHNNAYIDTSTNPVTIYGKIRD